MIYCLCLQSALLLACHLICHVKTAGSCVRTSNYKSKYFNRHHNLNKCKHSENEGVTNETPN